MFSRHKKLLITILIFLVLIGAGVFYKSMNSDSPTLSENQKGNVEGQLDRENRLNDKSSTDTEAPNTSKEDNNTTSTKTKVTPTLTRWGVIDSNVEASGFIQGIYEDGGTCTFTFTKDQRSVSRTSTGFKDATTTSCTPVQVSLDDFTEKGNWNVQLQYSSTTAAGESSKQALNL